jgi:hypothetical protein
MTNWSIVEMVVITYNAGIAEEGNWSSYLSSTLHHFLFAADSQNRRVKTMTEHTVTVYSSFNCLESELHHGLANEEST